jgi:N-acetylglucosaminyldiphosphoundecaprenol N-acetyl-beta-D-mannosaminyltransferase
LSAFVVFAQRDRVELAGVSFDALDEATVVAVVRDALDRGEGGRIVTPNVDILRLAERDAVVRGYLADASLVVADGMPLIWASRLAGTPLPERVPGSSLIWSLSAGLAGDGRSIYLLGGEPGAAGRDGASRAAAILATTFPGVRIAGHAAPAYGFDSRLGDLTQVCADVIEAKPDLVVVGLGFHRQERLISMLRADLPGAWFLGCGASINFVAGDSARAPQWMQNAGLEWLHRLAAEPRRLAGRYLRHDVPYAVRLLAASAARRQRGLK